MFGIDRLKRLSEENPFKYIALFVIIMVAWAVILIISQKMISKITEFHFEIVLVILLISVIYPLSILFILAVRAIQNIYTAYVKWD